MPEQLRSAASADQCRWDFDDLSARLYEVRIDNLQLLQIIVENLLEGGKELDALVGAATFLYLEGFTSGAVGVYVVGD